MMKPTLSLTLGVTGHRQARLGDADVARLRQAVDEIFSAVQHAASQVSARHREAFSSPVPQLRLISPLADGADTISAEAALAAGWRLDVALPFPRDDYAHDFTDCAARERYGALLERATSVFELVGDREESEVAYEAVGKVLLDQTDILLALWDGNTGRGRGGTSRVVADAVHRHIPVVHIDTTGVHPPMLLWSGLAEFEIEQPSVENVPRAQALRGLPLVVSTLTAPPENEVDRRMLARFYAQQSHRMTPAVPYPLLLAASGIRALRRSDFTPPSAHDCSAALASQAAVAEQSGPYAEAMRDRLLARYGVADAASTYFAQIFRSGFVANFGLATVAVLLALGGSLFPAYKFVLISIELAVIVVIVLNTRAGTRAGWHETWMDDRHLAEQLRALAMTSSLGNLNLRPTASSDIGSLPGWVHWLTRATARELGVPQVVADHTYLKRVQASAMSLVEDQIAYHELNAHRMHKLEHRLHHLGELLFALTILACVGWIAVKLAGLSVSFTPTIGLTEVVTALTTALPAIGAAIYGIRMQGDFVGIADRSEATVARLKRLMRSLDDENLDYTKLLARLRRLAEIMLTDVEHWRTTYQARPLALPG